MKFCRISILFVILSLSLGAMAGYNPEKGRFIKRDPIEEDGGVNVYGFVWNDGINKWDYLGMFEVYGWPGTDDYDPRTQGHVGAYVIDTRYDYGRYRGKYAETTTLMSGPNIFKKSIARDTRAEVVHIRFLVCKEIDKKVQEKFEEKFKSGAATLPPEIVARLTKKTPLNTSERYMGTDWSLSDNCQSFTLKTIMEALTELEQKTTKKYIKDEIAAIRWIFISAGAAGGSMGGYPRGFIPALQKKAKTSGYLIELTPASLKNPTKTPTSAPEGCCGGSH